MLRVAIVEDEPGSRAAIAARCRREADFSVVGEWETADDAAREADWRRVDVLVVDLELPGSMWASTPSVSSSTSPRNSPRVGTQS